MRNLVRRYVTVEQRKAENQGVTEDDVNEIKQDISAFRCELVEILKNSGMNTSTAATTGQGIPPRGSKLSCGVPSASVFSILFLSLPSSCLFFRLSPPPLISFFDLFHFRWLFFLMGVSSPFPSLPPPPRPGVTCVLPALDGLAGQVRVRVGVGTWINALLHCSPPSPSHQL